MVERQALCSGSLILGFAATDFIITITLSAADASAHLIENPFTSHLFHGQSVLITKVNPWAMFGKFFWGPMPWMIEAAALMSILVNDWVDFAIILVLLLFNAILGFGHERQALSALDALKGALAQEAQALRDGKWQTVLAKMLVPGDIVRVRLGNVVPADVKLIEGDYLDVDQSALTGESLPVSKKVGELAYSGSIAKKGEMTAVVTVTGAHTFFGRKGSRCPPRH